MAKLIKQKYYTASGESKINNYMVKLSKAIVEQSNIKDTDEIKISVVDGKIIIEVAKWFGTL